ncbi:MAG TPA: hypothetical protein VJU59_50965 [Paraburkholderia sp.]|uniref:hypothetical protein n=1 Tax=Paraburkholderia sp. TaxID=1926495 RepID=UPI002B48F40F|nr:hypothetical protein [Paraburkholderia sp.]HKR47904.1 hypothetical protein [Paraburkholderia sp.]
MIIHASIPARNPRHVAGVLAEIWGGFAAPFPSFPGAWMAVAGDERGTIIETYPSNRIIAPGDGDGSFTAAPASRARYSAFHMAIATGLDVQDAFAIGEREGWRTVRCTRGQNFFDVVEFWIENTTMLELLTPEMQSAYRSFATPRNFLSFASDATHIAASGAIRQLQRNYSSGD